MSMDTDIIQSMAALPSKTPSFDLLQNCDLPPPLKVFPGINPTAKLYGLMGDQEDEEDGFCGGDDRVGLLKALQLSQTRAREAEKRIEGFTKERDCLSDAVLRESLQGMAYRNWVRVLECQVSVLKLKVKQQEGEKEGRVVKMGEGGEEVSGWFFSWVIPLGIAGLGFGFALRFLF